MLVLFKQMNFDIYSFSEWNTVFSSEIFIFFFGNVLILFIVVYDHLYNENHKSTDFVIILK